MKPTYTSFLLTLCFVAVAGAVLTLGLTGCGKTGEAAGETRVVTGKAQGLAPPPAWSPPELDTSDWALDETAFSSEKAAVLYLLAALEKGDQEAIEAATFNGREYEDYLYPYLPVSAPVRNSPAEFVWKQHGLKVLGGMKETLRHMGGQRFSYVRHRFTADPETYGPFTLHRHLEVTVTDPEGVEKTLKPCRSIVELHGRFKIFSFHD